MILHKIVLSSDVTWNGVTRLSGSEIAIKDLPYDSFQGWFDFLGDMQDQSIVEGFDVNGVSTNTLSKTELTQLLAKVHDELKNGDPYEHVHHDFHIGGKIKSEGDIDLDPKDDVLIKGQNLAAFISQTVGALGKSVRVADTAARDSMTIEVVPTFVFVDDDGDSKWALYLSKALGDTSTFNVSDWEKVSDPDLFNTAMSKGQIEATLGDSLSNYLPKAGGNLTGNVVSTHGMNLGDKIVFDSDVGVDPAVMNLNSNTAYDTNSTNKGVANSPQGRYIWHDWAAFCRTTTPKLEKRTTADGVWSEDTLDKVIFNQKQSQSRYAFGSGVQNGCRWTWEGGTGWSSISKVLISFNYVNPSPEKNIIVESSTDGVTWVERHNSTTSSYSTVMCNVSDISGDSFLRVTILNDSASGEVRLASLKLLTNRLGSQGYGQELEIPYDWDEDRNITVRGTLKTDGLLSTNNPADSQKARFGYGDSDDSYISLYKGTSRKGYIQALDSTFKIRSDSGELLLSSDNTTMSGNAGVVGDLAVTGDINTGLVNSRSYGIKDIRNDGDILPKDFTDRAMSLGFTNQIAGATDWESVITMRGWDQNYATWQLISSSNNAQGGDLYFRSGSGETWDARQRVVMEGDLDSYLPLTGGNLSGNIISSKGAAFGGASITNWDSVFTPINNNRASFVGRSGVNEADVFTNTYYSGGFKSIASGSASRLVSTTVGALEFYNATATANDEALAFTKRFEVNELGEVSADRFLQGGVTDDGTTGIQGVDGSFNGSLGSVVLGQSPSSTSTTGNSIKYTRDGANYLIYGAGGTNGSLRIGSTSSLTNALFTQDLASTFYGDVTLDSLPTGTQVGLVGYDANGKLIQGDTYNIKATDNTLTNMNSVFDRPMGLYFDRWQDNSNTVTDKPFDTNDSAGVITMMDHHSKYGMQIASGYGSDTLWVRRTDGGTAGDWNALATRDYVDANTSSSTATTHIDKKDLSGVTIPTGYSTWTVRPSELGLGVPNADAVVSCNINETLWDDITYTNRHKVIVIGQLEEYQSGVGLGHTVEINLTNNTGAPIVCSAGAQVNFSVTY